MIFTSSNYVIGYWRIKVNIYNNLMHVKGEDITYNVIFISIYI